jgi:hypothetical protein
VFVAKRLGARCNAALWIERLERAMPLYLSERPDCTTTSTCKAVLRPALHDASRIVAALAVRLISRQPGSAVEAVPGVERLLNHHRG